MSDLFGELASLLGKDNILTDPASLLACSFAANFAGSPVGRISPLAIVRPKRIDQLPLLLQYCSRTNTPLAIRGAATAPYGNSQPVVAGTIVLELAALNRVLEMDRENRVAHVQAGVTLQALREAAARENLFYPFNAAPVSTIGGNIAMNVACGNVLEYGPLGAWIQELEVYSTAGERIICHSQTGALVAGFPLAPVFCGSAGCLGVIASCKLRLLPMPESTVDLLFSFSTQKLAADAFLRLLTLPLVPASLTIFDPSSADLLHVDSGRSAWLLACSFHGSECEVRAAMELARRVAENGWEEKTLPIHLLLPALARGGRHFALEILQSPPSRFPRLLEGIDVICQRHGLEAAIFGSPFRLNVALFNTGDTAALAAASHDLFVFELMLNEKMACETEAALTRAEWQQNQALVGLSEKLRPLFDPSGLLSAHPLPGARRPVL